jgi:hypothetical protein
VWGYSGSLSPIVIARRHSMSRLAAWGGDSKWGLGQGGVSVTSPHRGSASTLYFKKVVHDCGRMT